MELDSNQIDFLLKRIAPGHFKGVYACDELPEQMCGPSFLVINTSPAIRPTGHWVGLAIKKNNSAEYFDSYGMSPFGKIAKFIENNSTYCVYNQNLVQQLSSNLCGYYAIFFVYMAARGRSLGHVMARFGSDSRINDKKIFREIHSIAGTW